MKTYSEAPEKDSDITVEVVAWEEVISEIRQVRTTVFVDEQNVAPDEEYDGLDPRCFHVLARDADGRAVGTGRLDPVKGKIGRLAVLALYRTRGVGSLLLEALEKLALENELNSIRLNAQTVVVSFYEKHGYVAEGPEFLEADIPHRHMEKVIG